MSSSRGEDLNNIQVQITESLGKYNYVIKHGQNILQNENTCIEGQFIQLNITIGKYQIPYNFTCITKYYTDLLHFQDKASTTSVELTWTEDVESGRYFLIYFDEQDNIHKFNFQTSAKTFTLKGLTEKSIYRICLAPINNQSNTGSYKCELIGTDFFKTGPVTDIKIQAKSSSKINVEWKEPKYEKDRPQGYVVMYKINSNNSDTNCKYILITIKSANIHYKSAENCILDPTVNWDSLGVVELDNLQSFTDYQIDIQPINGNKPSINAGGIQRTWQGRSGPVTNVRHEITKDGDLRIYYQRPKQINGIIKYYRVDLTRESKLICSNETDTQIHEDKQQNMYADFPYVKCTKYQIKVFPVNNWTENGGYGVMTEYHFNPDETKPTLTYLTTEIISLNLVQVKWAINKGSCDLAYTFMKISDDTNNCIYMISIVTTAPCYKLWEIIRNHLGCNGLNETKFIVRYLSEIYLSGQFVYGKKYYIETSVVTKQLHILSKQEIINTMLRQSHGCFTDCQTQRSYNGIRSFGMQNIPCINWKSAQSKYSKYFPSENSNYCKKSSNYAWCPTSSAWSYCSVPYCHHLTRMNTCVSGINLKSNNYSISISIPPKAEYNMKSSIPESYIILINYPDKNQCLKYYLLHQQFSQLGHQVKNFYLSCKEQHHTNSQSDSITFDGLHQNTAYRIFVIPILDSENVGSISNISFSTQLAKPQVPSGVRVELIDETTITLHWNQSESNEKFGAAESYIVFVYRHNNLVTQKELYSSYGVIDKLDQCTEYCFEIQSQNSAGSSELSQPRICNYTLAPKLSNVRLHNISNGYTSLRNISWQYLGGEMCERTFEIILKSWNDSSPVKYTTSHSYFLLHNLTYNMKYSVNIIVHSTQQTSNNIQLNSSNAQEFYTGNNKFSLSKFTQTLDYYKKNLSISWIIGDQEQDSILQYLVFIYEVKDAQKSKICSFFRHLICSNCDKAYDKSKIPSSVVSRRTADESCEHREENSFNRFQKNFTVNFVKAQETFTNYSLSIYAVNLLGHQLVHGQNISNTSNTSTAMIPIIMFIIILILSLILFLLFVFIKRKPKSIYQLFKGRPGIVAQNHNVVQEDIIPIEPLQNDNTKKERNPRKSKLSRLSTANNTNTDIEEQTDDISPQTNEEIVPELAPKITHYAITISKFEEYSRKVTKNNNAELIAQYKKLANDTRKLQNELGLTHNTGKLAENSKKNRFINILPYDQNRIILQGKSGNGTSSNYINASFVPGCEKSNTATKTEYLACQGPIHDSIDDFWLMIWQQNVKCIVMLTRCTEDEKFKCIQYWPEDIEEKETYGHCNEFSVKLINEDTEPGHINRVLEVTNGKEADQVRHIKMLHMHTWSDHSAPNLEYFDRLLFRFHEICSESEDYIPYMIHCSAGVGRTGTFICLDRIIRQLVGGSQEINIYDTVLNLRRSRVNMVQRQAQYVFIHEYINHFLQQYLNKDDEDQIYFND